MKKCGKCGEVKPFTEFYKSSTKRSGCGSYCKPCQHEHYKMRYHYRTKVLNRPWQPFKAAYVERNRQYVLEYLLCHPCVDCGESDVRVLDFDHVRGQKLGNVCALILQPSNLAKLVTEINKCEVRCANCHRRRTASEHNWFRNASGKSPGKRQIEGTEMLALDLHPEYSCLVLRP